MLIASMLPLRMLGLLMLMFSLCDADSGCSGELTLDPPEVLAEYGESVFVNCSSAENDHDILYWRVGSTKFQVENSVPMSLNLTDWHVTAECILLKNDTQCRKDLTITLYRNPESVIMFPTKYEAVVEGRPYELQCDVSDVAPVQHLTVRWYIGNDTIKTDYSTQLNKTKRPVSESFTLAANFSRGENGAQVRCEAQLDFGQHRSQPVNSNIHTVSVHYAPELKNKTEDVYVNEGDHVTLNCEAEGNPAPAFHWSLDGVNLMKSTDYLNITPATSAIYNCTATNYLGNATKQIHVHVMKMNRAPVAITTPEPSTQRSCPLVLTPAEIVVRFGDPVSVNCSTSATGVFRMGWEATSGAKATSDNATTWNVEKVEEWVAKPLCFITLNDSQCFVMLDITVYKTPDNVSVSALDQGPMVEGTEYRLKCDITNVAPVEKLKLTWYRGNEPVHTEMFNGTTETPVTVSSTLRVTPERDHNGALFRCEAELRLGQNGSDLGPTVTSSPYMAVVHYTPQVKTCPGSYAGVEHNFSIDSLSCEFDGNPPPRVLWYYEEKLIDASEPLNRTQSGEYTAAIVNSLGSSNISVLISIEYGPSFTCDDRYKVKEGGIFQCEAAGLPQPLVTWFKGEEMERAEEVAALKRLTKNDRGTYLLKAINKHGEARHRLYVDVFYAPVFNGSYSKEVNVILGDNVTFDCSADGNPPPEIKWSYCSKANVTVTTRGSQKSIIVTGATSTDAGDYDCIATNEIDVMRRTVTLVVQDRPKPHAAGVIWWLLILLVIVLIIIIIIIFAHRWTKKGQYTFVSDKANNQDSGIPMTPQSNGV